MANKNIYGDIQARTGGDIYIGVVGPVRTGKSTFIKRFMDKLVIPNIEDGFKKERANDELPQSAQGKTIMTTEPKFVPNEAVSITLDGNASLKVRLIDCVGYVIPEAMGHIEDGTPRMVMTPWSENEMPFELAAETGTKKVIEEHSTIGLVVTTDGTVTEIERESYTQAEARVIGELQAINKPFIVLLNSAYPDSKRTLEIKKDMEEKYNTTVMAVNCAELTEKDIGEIMEKILFEFPITEININMPGWIAGLDGDHWLKSAITDAIKSSVSTAGKIRDYKLIISGLSECEYIKKASPLTMELGIGAVNLEITLNDDMFYRLLSESSGLDISSDEELMRLTVEMAEIKKEYEKFAPAIEQVQNTGYAIISPSIDELVLEEPEIVRQGSRYGVRLKASAPSIHMICNKLISLKTA